jgi:glutaminyl-peptide cyclotransferase
MITTEARSTRRSIHFSVLFASPWLVFLVVSASSVGCLTVAQDSSLKFDGDRAHEHVRQLVAIGPRVAGTAGAEKARAYITAQISALGLTVEPQPFEARTPLGPVKMVNLRATLPGGATNHGRLIIAGHYDTKLFRDFTFVGANDGGSSAAFLIELARALKARQNAQPIELLFLDGEEAVVEWTGEDRTYGSRHYVEDAVKRGTLKEIRALILVDMIGDRDLRILRDTNSTGWLTDIVWSAAKDLNITAFVNDQTAIEDDHLPFVNAGVPAVDVIDLEYPAWHTSEDTLDQVAPSSLQAVGDTLLAALPRLEKNAGDRR